MQIILLLAVGRLMGEVMQRMGQPAVMGQLLAGLLLGPSVLGALWPEAQHAIFPANGEQRSMIGAVSQLGILMLLLLTGMETDLSLVRKTGRAAFSVSVTGIAIPARDLRRETVLQRERLDQLVDGNDEHREMVARLERIYDSGEPAALDDGEGLELRSGDELAAEVERFLREQKG